MSIAFFSTDVQDAIDCIERGDTDVSSIGEFLRRVEPTLNMNAYQVHLLFHRLVRRDLKQEAFALLCKCNEGIRREHIEAVRSVAEPVVEKAQPSARRRLIMTPPRPSSLIAAASGNSPAPPAPPVKDASPKTPRTVVANGIPKVPPPIFRRTLTRHTLTNFINENYRRMPETGNEDHEYGVTAREIVTHFNLWIESNSVRQFVYTKDPAPDTFKRVLKMMNIGTFEPHRNRANIYRIYSKNAPPPPRQQSEPTVESAPTRGDAIIVSSQPHATDASSAAHLTESSDSSDDSTSDESSVEDIDEDDELSDYETTGMFVPDGHVSYESDASINEELHHQLTMVRAPAKRRRLRKKGAALFIDAEATKQDVDA